MEEQKEISKKEWIAPELVDLDVNGTNNGSYALPSDTGFIQS